MANWLHCSWVCSEAAQHGRSMRQSEAAHITAHGKQGEREDVRDTNIPLRDHLGDLNSASDTLFPDISTSSQAFNHDPCGAIEDPNSLTIPGVSPINRVLGRCCDFSRPLLLFVGNQNATPNCIT